MLDFGRIWQRGWGIAGCALVVHGEFVNAAGGSGLVGWDASFEIAFISAPFSLSEIRRRNPA
jgi:hypothetical protein